MGVVGMEAWVIALLMVVVAVVVGGLGTPQFTFDLEYKCIKKQNICKEKITIFVLIFVQI